MQRRSFELRKSLVLLRRVVLPMREVVNSLMRRDLRVVTEPLHPYYQDVYDHVLRATEWTESLRDLVTTILETNLTIQGNRMNVITKKVTSWAAIIAVPTLVTGVYGMNVPYPGFGKPGECEGRVRHHGGHRDRALRRLQAQGLAVAGGGAGRPAPHICRICRMRRMSSLLTSTSTHTPMKPMITTHLRSLHGLLRVLAAPRRASGPAVSYPGNRDPLVLLRCRRSLPPKPLISE